MLKIFSSFQAAAALLATVACVLASLPSPAAAQDAPPQPNILWLTSEDNGIEIGAYGDKNADTPNIDRLAERSLRFTQAWSNAPVCAPARTAIITGMWPPSLGASNMRSEVPLPAGVQLFPQLLRQAGYYCTNNSKEDYNVIKPDGVWDESSPRAHYKSRAEGQPFFAVFNSTTSHESRLRTRPHKAVHDVAQVDVPEYHPDLPQVRQDWAQYYDRLTEMDREQGKLLQELDEAGLADSTIIFYFGDHGSGMPRGKRWLYQSGLHVPLIVHLPPQYEHLLAGYAAGAASERLVSFIDLAPTVLSLCGIEIPATMHGEAFAGESVAEPPKFQYGFRDRMDERYDCSRAVSDGRYLYVRNFAPHRAQGQYLQYMYETPTTTAWLSAARNGLPPAQMRFWQMKPPEEFYDLQNDPDQTENLIGTPSADQDAARLKSALYQWLTERADLGLLPESVVLSRADEYSLPPGQLHAAGHFDAEPILDAADKAISPKTGPETIDGLLASDNPAIQYWSVIGRMYLGLQGQDIDMQPIEDLTDRQTPIVSIIAAEALARAGDSSQRERGINVLTQWIEKGEPRSNTMVRLAAMDAMLAANPKSQELPEGLDRYAVPTKDLPGRYNSYVSRLVESLQWIAEHPESQTPL